MIGICLGYRCIFRYRLNRREFLWHQVREIASRFPVFHRHNTVRCGQKGSSVRFCLQGKSLLFLLLFHVASFWWIPCLLLWEKGDHFVYKMVDEESITAHTSSADIFLRRGKKILFQKFFDFDKRRLSFTIKRDLMKADSFQKCGCLTKTACKVGGFMCI